MATWDNGISLVFTNDDILSGQNPKNFEFLINPIMFSDGIRNFPLQICKFFNSTLK